MLRGGSKLNFYVPDRFDLKSLLQFDIANYLCENCRALFNLTVTYEIEAHEPVHCPYCNVKYVPVKSGFKSWDLDKYLESEGLRVKFSESELIPHIKNLHLIASKINQGKISPLRGLFQLLLNAKKFIHITSYGISHVLVGALKTVAQQVDVRCIIAGLENQSTFDELMVNTSDAPRLEAKIYDRNTHHLSAPHQKIIIIDGLIGFKGSTNLTLSGWRKAEQNLDMLEVITDINEIVEVNNRYFSPLWANPEKTEIDMWDLPF
jgi:DNA-directed RNA polymerase subunit RPC12/RpoP